MVLEEVWVLVEVDGLERKLAETFATVGIRSGSRGDTSATELGTCTILGALAVISQEKKNISYLIVHAC